MLQKKCVDYYKGDPDVVNFSDKYKGNITYLDKLKVSYKLYILFVCISILENIRVLLNLMAVNAWSELN